MSHKPQPLPCLVAIAITLLCSTVRPAECGINKNLRTPELNSRLNELADDDNVYLKTIWPREEELTRYRIDLSMLPPAIVEHAGSWVRRIFKTKWLPTEIETHLIVMKDWKRRERRVFPDRIAFGRTVDALILEFSRGGYNFQIQEDGYHLGVLVFPVKPNRAAPSIEEHLTSSIYKFLNVPPSKIGGIEYTLRHGQLGDDGKIYYGRMWCEWDEKKNSNFDDINLRTWWNCMSVCTDGNFVFLSISEDLPNPNRRPTAIAYTTEHHPRF